MTSYTFTTLHDPLAVGLNDTVPVGINAEGQIIGWYQAGLDGPYYGFLYSGGSYTILNDPANGGNNGSPLTLALGINDKGQVVGEFQTTTPPSGDWGFLYSGGTYTTLYGPPGAINSNADGINDAGVIVGNYADSTNADHGFLYSNGSYTILNDPLGVHGTGAFGINNKGQVVGIYGPSDGLEHGFLYSNGKYTTIDDPLRKPSPKASTTKGRSSG